MTREDYDIEVAKEYTTLQERIATLEKENAELKAFKEKCKFNVSDIFKEIETENNLTKAKEIINDFLLMAKVEHLKDRYETVDEAEQFLSEVEK